MSVFQGKYLSTGTLAADGEQGVKCLLSSVEACRREQDVLTL